LFCCLDESIDRIHLRRDRTEYADVFTKTENGDVRRRKGIIEFGIGEMYLSGR